MREVRRNVFGCKSLVELPEKDPSEFVSSVPVLSSVQATDVAGDFLKTHRFRRSLPGIAVGRA